MRGDAETRTANVASKEGISGGPGGNARVTFESEGATKCGDDEHSKKGCREKMGGMAFGNLEEGIKAIVSLADVSSSPCIVVLASRFPAHPA